MRFFFLLIFFLLMFKNIFSFQQTDTTDWEINPSFKYDVLCFLNSLIGDEFYMKYFQDEHDKFKDKLTPEVKDALTNLNKKLKHDGGKIISAYLCLYFSATDDETLDEMINTLDNLEKLKDNFKTTPYNSEEGWVIFESCKNELKTIFNFLKDIGFPEYWKSNVLPIVEAKINEFKNDVSKYNVIGNVEQYLGYKLPSNKIIVYMLYYSRPHGIKITGMRFLTDVAWPFNILIRTATHEMMHPPFDLKNDTELINNINKLKEEKFLMDKVLNHNPSFGYNSLEGFVEEDCVQALDQIINEKLEVAKDARKRWKENDDGMHVLAVALYNLMKEENYNYKGEVFRDFFIKNIENGKLLNGNIEKIYNGFYAE